MREDAGRGWRRVVPSPEPREIVELEAVRDLSEAGALVVCSGGGGVPVVRSRGALSGIDAVIDKDLAAALLATELGADALLILTDVPQAYVHYGTPEQEALARVTRQPDARLRRRRPLQGRLHGPQGRGLPALRRRRRRNRDRLAHRGRPGARRQGRDAHRAGRAGEGGRRRPAQGAAGQDGQGARQGRRHEEGGGPQGSPPSGRAAPPRPAAPTSSTSPPRGGEPPPSDGLTRPRGGPHEQAHRQHPAGRRLPHARRVRAAQADLDALAGAARQLAPGRQARPALLGRGGHGHLALRARHRGRQQRPVRERRQPAARLGARRRALEQRRLDARLRPELRRQRQG